MAVTRMDNTLGYAPEYAGKSTDERPTEGVPNGATFLEMDTSKVYVFDEAAQEWLEL